MAKVCLLVMVKDEGAIIDRCLASYLPYVDEAVLCDTGSTDDTVTKAERFFKIWGKPYHIFHEPWVNFGHNRTRALELASQFCDYVLFADADIELIVHDPNWKDHLTADAYRIRWQGGLNYRQPKLTKNDLLWKYKGATHEYLSYVGGLPEGQTARYENIDSISFHEHYDGSSRAEKFERDIKLLEEEIATKPNDPDMSRWLFYLAQSFWDLKQWDKALENYLKRAERGGWAEEVYYSLYRAGCCAFELDRKWEGTGLLFKAHAMRPSRMEAIFTLCLQFYQEKNYAAAYLLGDEVAFAEQPASDILFIHRDIYDWRFKEIMSICAWFLGRKDEGLRYFDAMINVPESEKARIEKNRSWFEDRKMSQPVALEILKDLKTVLNENNVRWWLHAGTLLGATREGDFIKHDTDLNLGVEAKTMNGNVIKELISKGFTLKIVHGRLKEGFEFVFERNGIRCDLFFFYNGKGKNKNKKITSCYHDWNEESSERIEVLFDPFEIEEMQFLGENFPAPTNKENYLAQHYGEDWKTPKVKWNYATDGPNLRNTGKRIKYTETKEDLEIFIKQ